MEGYSKQTPLVLLSTKFKAMLIRSEVIGCVRSPAFSSTLLGCANVICGLLASRQAPQRPSSKQDFPEWQQRHNAVLKDRIAI